MANKLNAASIQKHLEVKEIKDDVVVLKNKGLRSVLMATSINFALKSTEERDAIIYRYQDFLNSLDFSLQIMTSSRKFDITPYIQTLEHRQTQQENELLRIQTNEYINFVKGLTQMTNVMTKSFYIIVPYSPSAIKKGGFFSNIFTKKEKEATKEESFQELKNNLWQRVEYISTGLRGLGIKTVPLNTEELIELFYKFYNPSAKEDPKIEKQENA